MTQEELKEKVLMSSMPPLDVERPHLFINYSSVGFQAPSQFDWRQKPGIVSPVYNQVHIIHTSMLLLGFCNQIWGGASCRANVEAVGPFLQQRTLNHGGLLLAIPSLAFPCSRLLTAIQQTLAAEVAGHTLPTRYCISHITSGSWMLISSHLCQALWLICSLLFLQWIDTTSTS